MGEPAPQRAYIIELDEKHWHIFIRDIHFPSSSVKVSIRTINILNFKSRGQVQFLACPRVKASLASRLQIKIGKRLKYQKLVR